MNSGASDEETFVRLSVSFCDQLQTPSQLVQSEELHGYGCPLVHHAMKQLAKHKMLIKPLQTRGKDYKKRFEALSKFVI